MIKVGETQECLDCFEVSRVGQTLTALVLVVSIEMPWSNHKAQDSIFCMWNRHFWGLSASHICEDVPRLVGHEPDALPMSRRYEDIIEVYHYKDISHVLEDVVHKGLKCSGSIGESHQHDQEFEGAIVHPEGCFPLMACCDTNIVVASMEVELGVDLCAAQLVEEVGNEWNWVLILSSDLVEVFRSQHRVAGCRPSSSKEDRGTTW